MTKVLRNNVFLNHTRGGGLKQQMKQLSLPLKKLKINRVLLFILCLGGLLILRGSRGSRGNNRHSVRSSSSGKKKEIPKCYGDKEYLMAPIHKIHRKCPKPQYETLLETDATISTASSNNLKICLTTLSDTKVNDTNYKSSHNCRDYNGVLPLTWENKQNYANKHGYILFDESTNVDLSRPPAWSKIHAVKRLLVEEKCDWVMWMDADTLFMNTNIKIESFLPSNPSINLLVTQDSPNLGYNSGVWLLKNSKWSIEFLTKWYNLGESFVRRAGLSKSGDNAAFKALLRNVYIEKDQQEGAQKNNQINEFYENIAVPPRCTFNSFAKFYEPGEKYEFMLGNLEKEEWYLDINYYHKGDFMVHVPGYDNKAGTIQMLLDLQQ